MAIYKKKDNHDPAGKLALRRHFLRAYHPAGPRRVLDCFQATGFLWKKLRAEFPLDEYLGLDIAPKKGRLKIDSARFLAAGGWPHNIIDLDAYGSPWAHWLALLKTCPRSATVFLTIGAMVAPGGGGSVPAPLREILGLHFQRAKIPPALSAKINEFGVPIIIAHARTCGFQIAECREAPGRQTGASSMRYLGLRLEK